MEFTLRPEPSERDRAYSDFRDLVLELMVSVFAKDTADFLVGEAFLSFDAMTVMAEYKYAQKTAGTPFRTPDGKKDNNLETALMTNIKLNMAETDANGTRYYKKETKTFKVTSADGTTVDVVRYSYKTPDDHLAMVCPVGGTILDFERFMELIDYYTVAAGVAQTTGSRARSDYTRNVIKAMYNYKKMVSNRTSKVSTSTGGDPVPSMSRTIQGALGDDRCARTIIASIADFMTGSNMQQLQSRRLRMRTNLQSLCSVLGADERGYGAFSPEVSNALIDFINKFNSGQDISSAASVLWGLVEDSDPDYTQVDIRYYQVPNSLEAMYEISSVRGAEEAVDCLDGQRRTLSNVPIWRAMCLGPAHMDTTVAKEIVGELRYPNYYGTTVPTTKREYTIAGRVVRRKSQYFGGKLAMSKHVRSGLNVNFKRANRGVNILDRAVTATAGTSRPVGYKVKIITGGLRATEYFFPNQKVANLPFYMTSGYTMNCGKKTTPRGDAKVIPVPKPVQERLNAYNTSPALHTQPELLEDPNMAQLIRAGTGNSVDWKSSSYGAKIAQIQRADLSKPAVRGANNARKVVTATAGATYNPLTGESLTGAGAAPMEF